MKFSYFLVFLCAIFSLCLQAQELPEKWLGSYAGKMSIHNALGLSDTVDVHFLMKEIEESSWTYTMTYTSEKYGRIIKDYILRQDTNRANTFILDEQNGIKIPHTLMSDCLLGYFEVYNQGIMSRICRVKEGIEIEMTSLPLQAADTTWSVPPADTITPTQVISYPPFTTQKALLKPQKEKNPRRPGDQ